ncbi:MAG TPA: arginine--tRNA ligase [Ignavibacteriaceae bacterium]|nr:arginine--tRNA ligase [Ignavibacteriaceae bacterium]
MKNYLYSIFEKASAKLPYLNDVKIAFDIPKNEDFGDYSSNAAMLLTKTQKRNPREIANEIISNLDYSSDVISKIEIAGPGFINFYFTTQYVTEIITSILEENENYGRTKTNEGKKANVEFVSANPTGPLTVGHGRNAVLGDTVATMLEWTGYKVDREFYFNNAGNQMRKLGRSVKLRYLQILGDNIDFPVDKEHYQGEYIKDIAQELYNEFGDTLRDEPELGKFKEKAEKVIFADIENTLKVLNINHDIFYNEKRLYDEGKIDSLLKTFKEKNLTYEQDGALWLKLSEMGRDMNKVIIKSTGEPTYRLPDTAYHIVKIQKGYDLIVDVFGSDHIEEYKDVVAGLESLGYKTEHIKVILYQFVTIKVGNEIQKMSTRKANYEKLEDLEKEVGKDVVRYFFNMRSSGTHMVFDIELAKKQTDENPVFYLQYAHARISSIIREAEKVELKFSRKNLNLLVAKEEQQLLKKLSKFKEEIENATETLEPHKICTYLEETAAAFHKFYTFCRVIGVDQNLSEARLALVTATRIILKNGLTILGLSAPERM